MKTVSKVVLSIFTIFVITVVIIGFTGFVKIPFITSSPQNLSQSYELTQVASDNYGQIQTLVGDSIDLPELSILDSYGLEYHLFGTDDLASVVEVYYDSMMSSWIQRYKESGNNWAVGLYQNILYGFGYAVGQDPRIEQLTGYSTAYITIEGPLTSWQQLIEDIEAARSG